MKNPALLGGTAWTQPARRCLVSNRDHAFARHPVSTHYHAVVWIDHHEARVIHFNADSADERLVCPAHPPRHLHSKAGSPAGSRAAGNPAFYQEVAEALASAQVFLVVGPANAKAELVKFLERHAPELHGRIAGIQTMDRVTGGQLVHAARAFFRQTDRMRPQLA